MTIFSPKKKYPKLLIFRWLKILPLKLRNLNLSKIPTVKVMTCCILCSITGSFYEKNGGFADHQAPSRAQATDVGSSPEPDGPLTDRLGENDLQRTLTHAPAAPWWRQRTWHSHGRATHDCPTRTTYTKNPIRGQEDRRDLTDCLPGLLFGIQCYVLVILFDQKVVELTLNRNNYTLRITRIYHQSITTITPITNDGSLVL